MSNTLNKSINLINAANKGVLLTLDENNQIHGRPIGAFGNEEADIYFVSRKDTKKVEHISKNPTVTFYLEDPGQKPEDFKYLSVTGNATIIDQKLDQENAKAIIKRKYSRLDDLLSTGSVNDWVVYKIKGESIKYYEKDENGPKEVIEKI